MTTHKKETIAIFDALGPIYHYDPKGWINGAAEGLLEKLQKHNYTFTTDNEVAQAEEDLQRSGKEQIHAMWGFAETALYLKSEGVRSVIVSAGTPWVLENVLDAAAKKYSDRTGNSTQPEQLVQPTDLITTIPLGSKKDPVTWAKAVERYGDAEILAVYEDTLVNLTAAIEGLYDSRRMGGPLCYVSGPLFSVHVTASKNGAAQVFPSSFPPAVADKLTFACGGSGLYRGHMEEMLPIITRRIKSEKKIFPSGRPSMRWD